MYAIRSYYAAQKNGGQVDLYVNSMVSEVTIDDYGKATGVKYINKEDRQTLQFFAKGRLSVPHKR